MATCGEETSVFSGNNRADHVCVLSEGHDGSHKSDSGMRWPKAFVAMLKCPECGETFEWPTWKAGCFEEVCPECDYDGDPPHGTW